MQFFVPYAKIPFIIDEVDLVLQSARTIDLQWEAPHSLDCLSCR